MHIPYPGALEPMVKWLLAISYYVVLFAPDLVVLVVKDIGWFAILFTGANELPFKYWVPRLLAQVLIGSPDDVVPSHVREMCWPVRPDL